VTVIGNEIFGFRKRARKNKEKWTKEFGERNLLEQKGWRLLDGKNKSDLGGRNWVGRST